jgi:carbonic anhydrase
MEMEEKQHVCKALVIHCIDFRFRKSLAEFLEARFGDSYDLVSVAGGVKRLVADPLESNFILEQVKISDRLHKPEVILLIQHEDCGAYGGSAAFGDFSDEQETQNQELEKAEILLKEQFPQPVEKYLARLSGDTISL